MGMVDISEKEIVPRRAVAEGFIRLRKETLEKIRRGEIKKGDPFEVSRVAAFLAVKSTPKIIPHCHPIPIEFVGVSFEVEEEGIRVKCEVKARAKTGVEMEALTGVSVALLTLWDMVKYLEKDERGQYPWTRISEIKVLEKVKGDGSN